MDLLNIVKRIEREAGFSVFIHACNRPEYDDKPIPNEDNYVRAVYQMSLKNPLAWHKYPPGVENPAIRASVYGITAQSEVVTYGELAAKGENVPIYKGNQQLSEVIETESRDPAYYLRLSIKAEAPDHPDKRQGYPSLTIFGNKELILNTVNYLEQNPENYLTFIKNVLPRDKYPNLNKNILDKARDSSSDFKPVDSIIFHEIKLDDLDKDFGWNFTNINDYVDSRKTARLVKILQ